MKNTDEYEKAKYETAKKEFIENIQSANQLFFKHSKQLQQMMRNKLEELLKQYPELVNETVLQTNNVENSALAAAVISNHDALIKFLLKYKANPFGVVNLTGGSTQTLLDYAKINKPVIYGLIQQKIFTIDQREFTNSIQEIRAHMKNSFDLENENLSTWSTDVKDHMKISDALFECEEALLNYYKDKDFTKFKRSCDNAIKNAQPNIDCHRGYGIWKKTDTAKLFYSFKETIENINPFKYALMEETMSTSNSDNNLDFNEFNQALRKIDSHYQNKKLYMSNSYSVATKTLLETCLQAKREFYSNKKTSNIDEFKQKCEIAIRIAAEEFKKPRGWKQRFSTDKETNSVKLLNVLQQSVDSLAAAPAAAHAAAPAAAPPEASSADPNGPSPFNTFYL